MPEPQRPSKKQKELLEFIGRFIAEHGYGPSYREIMSGCSYTSVATVSLHVNNLIKKGQLRKKDRSARSLEIAAPAEYSAKTSQPPQDDNSGEKWLMGLIGQKLAIIEDPAQKQAGIQKIIEALKILNLETIIRDLETRN